MPTKGPRGKGTLLRIVLAVILVSASTTVFAQTPLLGQEEDQRRQEIPLFWSEFSDGGVANIKTPNEFFQLPLQVSTIFVDGRPLNDSEQMDYLMAGQSDVPSNTTVVLRGKSAGATGVMVLKEARVSGAFNSPMGESLRFNIPPLERQQPEVEEQEDVLDLTSPEQFRGPIQSDVQVAKSGPFEGVDVLHMSPRGGGSVWTSLHIYSGGDPIDPMNAWFYDSAGESYVDSALTDAGWSEEGRSWCASTKEVLIRDHLHGSGTDYWDEQSRHYTDPQECDGARYHLRTFPSRYGDTHTPGFDTYLLAPVHYEDGIGHSNVYPQTGQDKLQSDMAGSPWISNYWAVSVPNDASECANCDEWDGWIDIYQLDLDGVDPCGSVDWTIYWGSVDEINFWCD